MPRRLVALVALVLLTGCGAQQQTAEYRAGDGSVLLVAPVNRQEPVVLSGSLVGGGEFDPASIAGKVTVVNFWASWCGPCRAEATDLAKAASALRSVSFVGIDTRDSEAAALAFQKRFPTGYPSIADPDGVLTLAFGDLGPAATPTTFVLDHQGRVAVRVLGQVTESQLRGLVTAVLEEK